MFLATLCLSAPAWAEGKTLWLVRPLYPGQDTLVERTEKALDKLLPGDARQASVIGKKELAGALKGRIASELPCFAVDARCADPIDPFVASFGFERIVLILGGQDEAGFKYKVTAYDPKSGKTNPASASNAVLEKALLGAVAKVVPAASTLDVKSTPPGATVYIDDVKVGTTPLNTQVLPGERVVRLDLKLHQPVEEAIIIPIRGAASFEKTLEKVAARIVITASPPGTEIFIDGVAAGKDKVDRGIAPGDHTIRLVADKYKAFEQSVSVKPDQQFALDKTLEPLPGTIVTPPANGEGKVAVVLRDDKTAVVVPVEPPKPPPTIEDTIYERRSYFHASFEYSSFIGNALIGKRFDNAPGRTTSFLGSTPPSLIGASMEYGTGGQYFGVAVFGFTYLTNADNLAMNVGYEPGLSCEPAGGPCVTAIDKVRIHLGHIRLLQPQLRFVLWRLQFSLQVGLELRIANILGTDIGTSNVTYKDGFMPLDLMLGGKLNVRVFIVEGLFLNLQASYVQALVPFWKATDESGKQYNGSASSAGFNAGMGYAF